MTEHYTETPTLLTDHERTVLLSKLRPDHAEEAKIGYKLAYNKSWRAVFKYGGDLLWQQECQTINRRLTESIDKGDGW